MERMLKAISHGIIRDSEAIRFTDGLNAQVGKGAVVLSSGFDGTTQTYWAITQTKEYL
jgi:hypothetical protein